jgi:hypothetical protein
MDFAPGSPAGFSRETIEYFKKALANPEIRKAITTAPNGGPQAYDLEPEVKSLFPVNTPLRNYLPRYFTKARGDVQTHWQAITGINTATMPFVVGEGKRAGTVTSQFVNRTAKYATLGLEDSVTEEARLAAQGYDDIDARVVANLIWACMISEEVQYLGGNNSYPLGVTPTPTLTVATHQTLNLAASSLTATATFVKCAALTMEGWFRATRNGNVPVGQVTRTVVGSTLSAGSIIETLPGGIAQISAEATVTPTAGDYIQATVTSVPGAVAYAWYVGSATGAEYLYAITTINSVLIGSIPATVAANAASALPATDQSAYSTSTTPVTGIDGILPMVAQAGLNGVYSAMPTGTIGTGTTLTANSTTITQIDNILLSMWNANQIGPDDMWVNAQELANISNKMFAAGAAAQIRYAMDVNNKNVNANDLSLPVGASIGYYLNRFGVGGPQLLNVRLHPYVPPGTIFFTTRKLPYPNSNVPEIMRVRGQLDYHEIAWGPFTRSAEYGVYLRCTLQIFAPFALAVLTNVGNG